VFDRTLQQALDEVKWGQTIFLFQKKDGYRSRLFVF
jgi:hypothetical protein